MRRIQKLRRDESGMSYVFVGLGFMAFLSASMLAIDVGMLMTSRNQAQNSADAGALAGATALVFDSFTDRSPTGPAVTSALAGARANRVMRTQVSVMPEDVTFPVDEFGEANRVQVNVYRDAVHGNPVSLLIAQYFGIETADISATATAEASKASGMTCVKPFTIPDKWTEKQDPPWDGSDTYDAFDNKGNPLANPDIYIPADQPGYTGYNQETNRGQRLVLRAGTGDNITVSFYYSIAIGEVTGGDEYRWNIDNCNKTVMHWGDRLMQEPGDKMGPTVQGIEALIARDPNARWDDTLNRVVDSAYGGQQSPRVFPIPLYDPPFYDEGKRNGRIADLKVANWIGFFAESCDGNRINGRIIPIAGIRDGSPTPEGLSIRAIRLVK
jgi:Putative Flp pilus-assembly TadE/G-like